MEILNFVGLCLLQKISQTDKYVTDGKRQMLTVFLIAEESVEIILQKIILLMSSFSFVFCRIRRCAKASMNFRMDR